MYWKRRERLPKFGGDVGPRAQVVYSLGQRAVYRGDPTAARPLFELSLSLSEQIGFLPGQALSIQGLGEIALRRREYLDARALFKQALELFRGTPDVLNQGNCLRSLGDVALSADDPEDPRSRSELAESLFLEAAAIFHGEKNIRGYATCLSQRGSLAASRGDDVTARRLNEEAIPLFQRIGSIANEGNCNVFLGEIEARQGGGNGTRFFDRALELFSMAGNPEGVADAHMHLARVSVGERKDAHIAAAISILGEDRVSELMADMLNEFGSAS